MILEKLVENIYYVKSTTNVGVIENVIDNSNSELILVDTGGSLEEAKNINEAICKYFSEKNININISTIINTHSHADHCGGNAFFKNLYNCKIMISQKEKGSIENPFIQPAVCWGGNPVPEIKNSYYIAEESIPDYIINKDDKIILQNNITISFIDLPGHYFGMIGVICKNAFNKTVLFAGDGIFGRKNIGKYWIPFLYNIDEFLDSLDKICKTNCDICVPGHGEITEQIEETAELNKIAIISTQTCILKGLKEKPMTHEEILKYVSDKNEIKLHISQYILIGSTIKAYLVSLYEKKLIKFSIKENKMMWLINNQNL